MPHDYEKIASGVAFENSDKAEGSKQPDWKGPGELEDATKAQLAFWFTKDKNGNHMISWTVSKVTPKDGEQQANQGQPAAQDDKDIPF